MIDDGDPVWGHEIRLQVMGDVVEVQGRSDGVDGQLIYIYGDGRWFCHYMMSSITPLQRLLATNSLFAWLVQLVEGMTAMVIDSSRPTKAEHLS